MPEHPSSPFHSIRAELADLATRGLTRRLRHLDGPQSEQVLIDGKPVLNFSSNNYLGLANHPALQQAATDAMAEHGFGAGASRLIVGSLSLHRQLEDRIRAWKRTDAALLFNSGYQANLGVLGALAGPGDVIYSDALNHASIVDGARLSKAAVEIFPHNDTDALARLLSSGARFRRRLVITESCFSMDGDQAPLAAIAALAREHHALSLVDEAHAVGVLGPDGIGLAAGIGFDLQIGTLGKALGGFGAYVAGPKDAIDLLINKSRSFIFTTALPVPVLAAGLAALDFLASDDGRARIARLRANVLRLHSSLRELRIPVGAPSHIVPLLVGDAERTMRLSQDLLDRGIFLHGIRPPTVPAGSSRLRLSLMATHTDAHLDQLIAALADLRSELHPEPRP